MPSAWQLSQVGVSHVLSSCSAGNDVFEAKAGQ